MTNLRHDLPPMPARLRYLPRDHRGYPVPWFVQWLKDGKAAPLGEGEPDFRVIDGDKMRRVIRGAALCWICGQPLGKHRIFTIGPMCCVNRVISEPPSHRDCAEFSVQACPFLSRPRMRRNDKDLPMGDASGGISIDRNPGVTCLWETPVYKPFRPHAGNHGWLFQLGDPTRVDWWAQARPATRAEVLEAIDSGLPLLQQMAAEEGDQAITSLAKKHNAALRYLPTAV